MPVAKVVVGQAQMIEAPATITLVGTVDPARRSQVAAEIAGLVVEMPARQGDEVPADGILCRLDPETLQLGVLQAEAKLAALQARHEELKNGTRPEALDKLKARFDEASAQFDRWKFEMERVEHLYDGRDSNEKEFVDAKAAYLVARGRKEAARADHELGVNGPRREVISEAEHAVAEQRAVVASAKADLSNATIRAPFAGYVVQRTVEVGEWVAQGGKVAELIELSTVLLRVDAPESAMPYLTVGNPARIQIDALKRSFEGRIKHIIPQADPRARTFPVEVEVDNGERLLAAGMFARVTLTGGAAEPVVAVPLDAIVERAGVAYVATVIPDQSGGKAGVLLPVTVGAEVGDMIAITSGNVAPGMQVITHGNEHILPFPTPVEIVDPTGSKIGSEPE